jgi:hypothetical protein
MKRTVVFVVVLVFIALGLSIQVGGQVGGTTTSQSTEVEKARTTTSESAEVEKALAMVTPSGKRGAEAEEHFKSLHKDADVSKKSGAKATEVACVSIGRVVICCGRGACCWWGPVHGYGCNF